MKEKNITRKQICTDLGIGINQIKYWEKNNNYPSADVLYRLADYLGVSLDTLMEISDTVISTPVPVSDSSKEVSVFYKKLIALCIEKNTNPTALCKTLGLAESAVTRWKRGSIPRDVTLKKIADYFDVSVDTFTTDDISIGSSTTVSATGTTVMWKKFVQLCNDKGVCPNRVCADLGYSKNAATKWKQGAIPHSTTLKKLADYFGISEDLFLSGDNDVSSPSVSVSSASSRLFALIDIMTEEELEDLEKYAAFLISRNRS
jgi:transcriptional regulator with XRE-family HTH domain